MGEVPVVVVQWWQWELEGCEGWVVLRRYWWTRLG